jgi:hypothetical protein
MFTQKEDALLYTLVGQMGAHHWNKIAQLMPSRTARQCRDRYRQYLVDTLVNHPWSPAEDELIARKYAELGPKWAEISKFLNGRSPNDIKNHWNKHIAKVGVPPRCPLLVAIPVVAVPQATQPVRPPAEVGFPFPFPEDGSL